MALAGGALTEADVRCAFYGDIFRRPGRSLDVADAPIRPDELDEFEQALLLAWWAEGSRVDPHVIDPAARTLVRAPRSVQAALRALSGSRFFAGVGERAMLGDVRQVRRYFNEPAIRRAACQRLIDAIDMDTSVVVGHSLGSVIAYEVLCANPEWPVRSLITLGSPLGVANLIFHRLEPSPAVDPGTGAYRGQWPGVGRSWVNVADAGDLVALVKDLRSVFGPQVEGWIVDNGARAHHAEPYLTAKETGRAIIAGLRRSA